MNLPHLPALKTIELNSVISFLYCQNFILLSTDKTSTEILSTDINVRTKIKGCRFLCENRLNSLLFVFQRQFRFWWRKLRMLIMKTSIYSSFGSTRLVSMLAKFPRDFVFIHAMTLFYRRTTKLPFKWNLFGSTFAWRYLIFGIYSYYKNFH